jgi:hypothetical protein
MANRHSISPTSLNSDTKIYPPIHAEAFLFGGAIALTFASAPTNLEE